MEATLESKPVCIFKTMIMQFEGDQKDVSSVAVLTDLKNIKIKQKPGLSVIVQLKRGNQNLGRVYFYLWLCVVFLLSFKINRIAV